MVNSATRFIYVIASHNYAFTIMRDSLGPIGGISANTANSQCFGDKFSHGKKLGYWFERFSRIILIQTGDDDSFALVRQFLTDIDQLGTEKLGFVNPYNITISRQQYY